jgi:hypothetical protein
MFTLFCAFLGSCSSDEACDPVAGRGCEDGLVCEEVTGGGEPMCTAPVVVRGTVFRLADATAIAGARVVASDGNGAPVSAVATSGADGHYRLVVPATRNRDGSPVGAKVTLRADAAGFATFPSGIRIALPIDTATAVLAGKERVVMSALTEVGLIALAGAGTGSIAGEVDLAGGRHGVLVVAEPQAGGAGVSAVTDRNGDYRIFNLAPGAWTVKAYAQGESFAPANATVVAGMTAAADLARSPAATRRVTGSINNVNPEGSTVTSVILVVESTFVESLARGEAPPGLRAGDVTDDFAIDGVPDGRYVVLAGFENDGLVRDPDTGIGGTEIVHIEVAGGDVEAGDFKITGARDTISPGRDAPEAVTARPMLIWEDDSSEDLYHVMVFDALGQMVWETDVPKATGSTPQVQYDGPLERGMVYQFRALSLRDKGGTTGIRPISSTEDLRGVFYMP